jgi:hypothetical protein
MNLQGSLLDRAEHIVKGSGANLPLVPIANHLLGRCNGSSQSGRSNIGGLVALAVHLVNGTGHRLGGREVRLDPLDCDLPEEEPP